MIIHLINRSLFVLCEQQTDKAIERMKKEVFGRAEEDGPGKLKRRK